MNDCLFCKIASKKIPANIIYEDEKIVVFKDINPEAPQHALMIPREHIPTINDVEAKDLEIMGYMMTKMPEIIKILNLEGRGVRIVNNCLEEAGQSVFHIHFHILGGRSFGWPPG